MSHGLDSFEFEGGRCRDGYLEFDKDAVKPAVVQLPVAKGRALIGDDELATLLYKGADQRRVAERRATPVAIGNMLVGTLGEMADACVGPVMTFDHTGAVVCNPTEPAKTYGELMAEQEAQNAAQMRQDFMGPVVSIHGGHVGAVSAARIAA